MKARRIIVAGMGAVAGFMLCGTVLIMADPSMDLSVIRFFSVLAGILLAGIAWRFG